MTFADSNRALVRYLAEAAWGTTPSSGVTREARITGSTLAAAKETVVSNELRADRMVSDVVEVGATSGGDLNFELAAGVMDDFLQAFLLGEWTRPMTFDSFKGNVAWATSSTITITGGDYSNYEMFTAGRFVRTLGFSTGSNNGYFEVDSVAHSAGVTTVTVVGTPGTGEAAGTGKNLFDGNDLILESTNIRSGTNPNEIDSAGNDDFASAIAAGQLVVGQKIRIDGFATAGTNTFYTITSLDDDVLGVTPDPADDANAGGNTVQVLGSHLRNPGDIADITPQSFTLETEFTDITQYMVQDGMRVGAFSLDTAAGAISTGSFTFSGRETTGSSSQTLGDTGTYDVMPTTAGDVMNATANVGTVVKDGSALDTCLQSINLTGDSGLRMQNAVGEKFPKGIGTGRFNLTGTVNAYFEDLDLWNDFINHTTVSLSWDVTDADGVTYYFTIPAAKFTSDAPAPSGIDQDIFEELAFTAFRDATYNTQFMVDRFSPAA